MVAARSTKGEVKVQQYAATRMDEALMMGRDAVVDQLFDQLFEGEREEEESEDWWLVVSVSTAVEMLERFECEWW